MFKEGRYFLPYNPKLVEKAKQMRKNPTPAEKRLWQLLHNTSPFGRGEIKIWRQKPIDNFIVDFYCPKLKLVIEVDGAGHFTEEGQVYDAHRTKILEGYGLQVIRFTNDEVLNNINRVWQVICGFIISNPALEGDSIPPNPPLKGGNWSKEEGKV